MQKPVEKYEKGVFYGYFGDGLDISTQYPQGRYTVNSKLGAGTYGKVFACVDNKYNLPVAIKIVRKDPLIYKEAAMKEIAVLRHLGGTHGCLRLLRDFQHDGHLCISMEMYGENIQAYMKRKGKPFDLDSIRDIGLQLAHACEYMHAKSIIHTDIKSENILLAAGHEGMFTIKLVDMGSSLFMSWWHPPIIGTMEYRAPETLLQAGWSGPVDNFASGCVLAELLSGKPLLPGLREAEHLRAIELVMEQRIPQNLLREGRKNLNKYNANLILQTGSQFSLPDVPLQFPVKPLTKVVKDSDMFSLLKGLLAIDPAQRLSASDAKAHTFFMKSNFQRNKYDETFCLLPRHELPEAGHAVPETILARPSASSWPENSHTKAIVREAEEGMAAKRRLPEAVWDSSKCLISDNPRFVRGDCGVCSKSVLSDNPCTKEKGSYYHTECLKTRNSSARSLQQMGDRGVEGVQLFFCNIPGCTREVWIGQKGEQCCRTCKASNGTSHDPDCEAKEARLAQRLAGTHGGAIAYPDMTSVEKRIETFKTWPRPEVNVQKLAAEGFFFQPIRGCNDRCIFYASGNDLFNWNSANDPWIEYKKLYPQCPYVNRREVNGAGGGADPKRHTGCSSSFEEELARAIRESEEQAKIDRSIRGLTEQERKYMVEDLEVEEIARALLESQKLAEEMEMIDKVLEESMKEELERATRESLSFTEPLQPVACWTVWRAEAAVVTILEDIGIDLRPLL